MYYFIDLEWFGSHGLLFLVNKLIENELEKRCLEMKFSSTEASFEEQVSINRNLRSQLTRAQRAAQDTEWRLQEQLVQAENHLQLEKSQNLTLRNQIDQLNSQVDRISELHSENNSNYGDGSVMTSPASTMSTPAMTWRDSSRRSTGNSSWSGSESRLMRVAEKLNITPNQAIIEEDGL